MDESGPHAGVAVVMAMTVRQWRLMENKSHSRGNIVFWNYHNERDMITNFKQVLLRQIKCAICKNPYVHTDTKNFLL